MSCPKALTKRLFADTPSQTAAGVPGRPLRLFLAAAGSAPQPPLPGDNSAPVGPDGDAGGVRYPDVYQGRSYADPVDGLAGSASSVSAVEASGREPGAEAGARPESEVFAETYQARVPRHTLGLACLLFTLHGSSTMLPLVVATSRSMSAGTLCTHQR